MTDAVTHPEAPAGATIDPEWTVNDLLRRHPTAVRVVNAFGIDTCCGGARTLREAATEDDVSLAELLEAIALVAEPAARD